MDISKTELFPITEIFTDFTSDVDPRFDGPASKRERKQWQRSGKLDAWHESGEMQHLGIAMVTLRKAIHRKLIIDDVHFRGVIMPTKVVILDI